MEEALVPLSSISTLCDDQLRSTIARLDEIIFSLDGGGSLSDGGASDGGGSGEALRTYALRQRAASEKEYSKRMASARIAKLIADVERFQAPVSREVDEPTIALAAAGADAVDALSGGLRTYTIPLPSSLPTTSGVSTSNDRCKAKEVNDIAKPALEQPGAQVIGTQLTTDSQKYRTRRTSKGPSSGDKVCGGESIATHRHERCADDSWGASNSEQIDSGDGGGRRKRTQHWSYRESPGDSRASRGQHWGSRYTIGNNTGGIFARFPVRNLQDGVGAAGARARETERQLRRKQALNRLIARREARTKDKDKKKRLGREKRAKTEGRGRVVPQWKPHQQRDAEGPPPPKNIIPLIPSNEDTPLSISRVAMDISSRARSKIAEGLHTHSIRQDEQVESSSGTGEHRSEATCDNGVDAENIIEVSGMQLEDDAAEIIMEAEDNAAFDFSVHRVGNKTAFDLPSDESESISGCDSSDSEDACRNTILVPAGFIMTPCDALETDGNAGDAANGSNKAQQVCFSETQGCSHIVPEGQQQQPPPTSLLAASKNLAASKSGQSIVYSAVNAEAKANSNRSLVASDSTPRITTCTFDSPRNETTVFEQAGLGSTLEACRAVRPAKFDGGMEHGGNLNGVDLEAVEEGFMCHNISGESAPQSEIGKYDFCAHGSVNKDHDGKAGGISRGKIGNPKSAVVSYPIAGDAPIALSAPMPLPSPYSDTYSIQDEEERGDLESDDDGGGGSGGGVGNYGNGGELSAYPSRSGSEIRSSASEHGVLLHQLVARPARPSERRGIASGGVPKMKRLGTKELADRGPNGVFSYYSTFFHIFSCSYESGNVFAREHGNTTASSFGENRKCTNRSRRNARPRNMTLDDKLEETVLERTWRLYVVWQQVMGDYATVFSYEDTSNFADRKISGADARNLLVYDGADGAATLQFRVNSSSRPEVYSIVTQALAQEGQEGWYKQHATSAHQTAPCHIYDARWVEMPTGLGLGTTWNLLWTWSKPRINYASLLVWQKVNHFPRSRELTRKDLLKRNISRMEQLCAGSRHHKNAFQIMPRTFVLPHEYNKFVNAFYEEARSQDLTRLAAQFVEPGGDVDDPSFSRKGQDRNGQASDADGCRSGGPSKTRVESLNYWILKPVGLSRGRGIALISDISEVKYDTQCVVQKYLKNPLLIDGYKCDLRLYVLVTSFQPLEAFLYTEGFVRLATRRFDLSVGKQDDLFVHLTNSSINKHNNDLPISLIKPKGGACSSVALERQRVQAYDDVRVGSRGDIGSSGNSVQRQQEELDDSRLSRAHEIDERALGGTKRTLPWLWRKLRAAGRLRQSGVSSRAHSSTCAEVTNGVSPTRTAADVWQSIRGLCVRTLLCVDGSVPIQPNSFELFGFDVILDDSMRPWLLEVNASPSMSRENVLDRRIKEALIRDTVALVDPLPFDRSAVVSATERRRRAKQLLHSSVQSRRELEEDIDRILRGRQPRWVGEMPRFFGAYEWLCPGSLEYETARKIKMALSRSGN